VKANTFTLLQEADDLKHGFITGICGWLHLLPPIRNVLSEKPYLSIENSSERRMLRRLHLPARLRPQRGTRPRRSLATAAFFRVPALGGHLKTGHRWTLQNRPTELNQNKNIYTPETVIRAIIFSRVSPTGFILA
jgi:hypothetical protein